MKSIINLNLVLGLCFILFGGNLSNIQAQSVPTDPDRIILAVDDGIRAEGCLSGPTMLLQYEPTCWYAKSGDSTVEFNDSIYINYVNTYTHLGFRYVVKDAAGDFLDVSNPLGSDNPATIIFDLNGSNPPIPFTIEPSFTCGTRLATSFNQLVWLPDDFPTDGEVHIRIVVRGKKDGQPWEALTSIEFIAHVCEHPSAPQFPGGGGRLGDTDLDFSVSPNPFSDQISIHHAFTSSAPVEVKLMDVNGKCVLLQKLEALNEAYIRLSTAHLPNGMYLLQLQQNGVQQYTKLLKTN